MPHHVLRTSGNEGWGTHISTHVGQMHQHQTPGLLTCQWTHRLSPSSGEAAAVGAVPVTEAARWSHMECRPREGTTGDRWLQNQCSTHPRHEGKGIGTTWCKAHMLRQGTVILGSSGRQSIWAWSAIILPSWFGSHFIVSCLRIASSEGSSLQ